MHISAQSGIPGIILTASLLMTFPVAADDVQSRTVGMSEFTIRKMAKHKPLPEYPADSIARKRSGVAVAAIASGADGRVTSVTVLEAPDDAISAAVREALLKWVVEPATILGQSDRLGLRGKVTFYFQIVAGRGLVANPEDLPGGPKPEPTGGPPSSALGVRAGGTPPAPPGTPKPAPTTTDHGDSPAAKEIGEAELRQLVATARPIVLDVREREEFKRGHRDGAINIPRDEIAVRSWIELDRSRPVVIDCSQAETRVCQFAARVLLSGPKFARVLIFLP